MVRSAAEAKEPGFGGSLQAARASGAGSRSASSRRRRASPNGESPRSSGATTSRPIDELGVLAQACGVSVFDLVPAGHNLRVLLHDDDAVGTSEANGEAALDALLREYLSMVVELRRGNTVTAPSLRHDDLAVLAANLGGTPAAIEARLVELLGSEAGDARALRALILPSTAS